MDGMRRIKSTMSRLKVLQKILAGFLVVLLLVAFIGIQFFRTVSTIGGQFQQVTGTAQDALATAGLAQAGERLDRVILNYVVTQTEAAQESAKAELSRFDTALAEVGKLAPEGDRSGLDAIQAAAADYRRAFEQVVAAVERRREGGGQTALVGAQMNTIAMAVVDLSVASGDQSLQQAALRLQQSVQAARLSTARYLTSMDPNDSGAARDEMQRLQEILESMPAMTTTPRLIKFLGALGPASRSFGQGLAAATQGTDSLLTAQAGLRQSLDRLLGQVGTVVRQFAATQAQAQETGRDVLAAGRTQAILMPFLAVLLGLSFAVLIGSSIARPVRRLTAAMVRLANGDRNVDIPGVEMSDEVGDMARAVQVFKSNAIEMETLRTAQEQQRRRAEEEKRAAMNALAQAFEDSVMDVVRHVVSEGEAVQGNAQAVADVSLQTRQHATQGAAATEQASVNVNLVAAAVEELTSSVASINQQVETSAAIARAAVEEARQADSVVASLLEAATRIGDVMHMIEAIAGQTNMLALNATIEAARAGEAGKGFAVVANEVKGLANQTTSATNEVSSQIQAIQVATRNAATAIGSIAETIGRMDSIATEVSQAIEQQFEATREIGRSLQQAAVGTTEVARTIGDVLHQVSDASQAADGLLGSAATLTQQTTILRAEVNAFTDRIRAA